MEQLILHLIGDYLTQSDWMAQNKTKSSLPAAVHALVYGAPFLLFLVANAPNPTLAGFVIVGTHFLIDRYRLARYVVWAKNWLGPRTPWYFEADGTWTDVDRGKVARSGEWATAPWSACKATGYPPERPAWLAVWLLIIADNTLHLAINYASLRWL
jgi:hypothetical protein